MNGACKRTIGLLGLGILLAAQSSQAANQTTDIDAGATQALERCYATVSSCKSVGHTAEGILVFPEITSAAAGIGGAYGEGTLFVDGKPAGHYSLTAGTIGLQLGAQKFSQVLMFMTPAALADFRASSGWAADAGAGVTYIDEGTSTSASTIAADKPVVGFSFGEKGLMGAAALGGSKISPIAPGQ
jgi:Uncharacterized conserved protein